jgi:hypothetical protein
MVIINIWKSKRRQATHCAICGEPIDPAGNWEKGTALLKEGEKVQVNYHESCAESARIQQGVESVKKGMVKE